MIFERLHFSNYIYNPLKRSFKSTVRITSYVLLAVAKFKKLLMKKKIERQQCEEKELKSLDFPPARFKMFSSLSEKENTCSTNLQGYFGVFGVKVTDVKNASKLLRLSNENLSVALEYLFSIATKEVYHFIQITKYS